MSLICVLLLRRLVRTDITNATDPSTWAVILPQHTKDLLTGSSALKVNHDLTKAFPRLQPQQLNAWQSTVQTPKYADGKRH